MPSVYFYQNSRWMNLNTSSLLENMLLAWLTFFSQNSLIVRQSYLTLKIKHNKPAWNIKVISTCNKDWYTYAVKLQQLDTTYLTDIKHSKKFTLKHCHSELQLPLKQPFTKLNFSLLAVAFYVRITKLRSWKYPHLLNCPALMFLHLASSLSWKLSY